MARVLFVCLHNAGRSQMSEALWLERTDAEWADVVVTMGCGDECPYISGKRYLDWDLPDPKGRPLEEVRATRGDRAPCQEADPHARGLIGRRF